MVLSSDETCSEIPMVMGHTPLRRNLTRILEMYPPSIGGRSHECLNHGIFMSGSFNFVRIR